MCTYNGERFIREQLLSILSQTLPPAEVIVSDDGSNDATLDIVRAIAAGTQVPFHIHQNTSRLGFSENFLQACDHARSPYIAFSDQDDFWSPRKLAAAVEALQLKDAQLCVHSVRRMDSSGVLIDRKPRRSASAQVIAPLESHPWGNYLGFTMLFNRALLDKIPRDERGEDPHSQHAKLSHDRWIYFLATTFGYVIVLNEDHAHYRQHAGQLYGGLKPRSLRARISTKLAEGKSQSQYLASIASYRASLIALHTPERDSERWVAAAARWRTISTHIGNSSRLYDSEHVIRRGRVLLTNLGSGAYRSFKHGGLGARRFVEDACIAALGGNHTAGHKARSA